jgi:hypothetical protein
VRLARNSWKIPIPLLATSSSPNTASCTGPTTRITASSPPSSALNRVITFARRISPRVRLGPGPTRLTRPAATRSATCAPVNPSARSALSPRARSASGGGPTGGATAPPALSRPMPGTVTIATLVQDRPARQPGPRNSGSKGLNTDSPEPAAHPVPLSLQFPQDGRSQTNSRSSFSTATVVFKPWSPRTGRARRGGPRPRRCRRRRTATPAPPRPGRGSAPPRAGWWPRPSRGSAR